MCEFSPLLLMQQGEQWASRDVLGNDGELTGVVQARPHKLDDTGVIEATEDGNLSAEHVYIRFWAVRVGSIAVEKTKNKKSHNFLLSRWTLNSFFVFVRRKIPFYGNNFISAFASVDSPKGACVCNAYTHQ